MDYWICLPEEVLNLFQKVSRGTCSMESTLYSLLLFTLNTPSPITEAVAACHPFSLLRKPDLTSRRQCN